jgi:Flagellar transcriptional activator (FlhC)
MVAGTPADDRARELIAMRLSDDRYESDRRKYTLALSMIEHGARTRTVTQWTGLSKYRVQTLTQSYQSTTRARRKRGESPRQPAHFFKSLTLARESMALAYIALQMQAIPPAVMPDARTSLPSLARGERLMSAFELYRALLPEGVISLEYAILLITELAERRKLALARCRSCQDVMLIDRLGRRQALCPSCRPTARASLPARLTERPPHPLFRQQQLHERVEEDNRESAHDGHD